MGLFSRSKPKIKVQSTKKDGFSGWVKCSQCSEMIHANELHDRLSCCPKCDYHYRLSAIQRIQILADEGTFNELFTNFKPCDPLKFTDTESYPDRIERAQAKSKRDEAICVGTCKLKGIDIALAVMDFSFMGGSMGSVVGERLTSLIEYAQKHRLPLIIVSASGGARMQESILSLMQMAKTSSALARLGDAGVPYISVCTNPTTGGITASFAMLGDINVAEPGALIGFAGPRVVEQITKTKLPPNAQRSEFLLEKGMIDCIISRCEMKNKLAFFIEILSNQPKAPKKVLKDIIEKSEEQQPCPVSISTSA